MPTRRRSVSTRRRSINSTKFIPTWVKVAVAIALGLGTMIGWKRIVVTVGERIGKTHLTYAQGASAELVAMLTIGAADMYGLPVSTTHVLSSGVAGTMVANRSGLQWATVRKSIDGLGSHPARLHRLGRQPVLAAAPAALTAQLFDQPSGRRRHDIEDVLEIACIAGVGVGNLR